MKVKVTIEETLCRTIDIDIPEDVGDPYKYIEDKYYSASDDKMILNSEDYARAQYWVKFSDGTQSEWMDM